MKNCLGTSNIQQFTEEPRGHFKQASAEFLPVILLQCLVLQARPWTRLCQTAFCRNAQGLTKRFKLFCTNTASLSGTESLAANCVMVTWISFLPWKTPILLNATAPQHWGTCWQGGWSWHSCSLQAARSLLPSDMPGSVCFFFFFPLVLFFSIFC